MSNNQSKVTVKVQNEPRYSLAIEGLTQNEVNRLHAIFNHVRVCEFVDGEDAGSESTSSKIRKAFGVFITKDVFLEFEGKLKACRH